MPRAASASRYWHHERVDKHLADTHAIALMTHVAHGTVRSWASRGHIARQGTGPRNRALYYVEDAEQLAIKRGLLDTTRHALQQ